MKKTLKKALSMLLTLVIAFSCFALVGNIEAKALPATDSTYARGDKYGTPAWSGKGDRWFLWSNGNADYVRIYYPSHIYLDVSETLQSAGYHFDVEWHFGDSHKYRILLGAPMWGDNSAYSGYPSKYYTMTNIFSDYKVDASLPPNAPGGPYGATYSGSSTDYDLRIVGYGHPNQGTDGFTVEGVRHEKYILWRSNTNIGNPAWTSIYLMGTPNSSYKGTTSEYNTSGASFASYGLAQYYGNGWGTDTNGTNLFLGKGDESSYMEGEWIEMAWNVTVYDKSALNSEIVKAGQILSAQYGYNDYVVQGSYDSLVQHNQEAQSRITVRAQTQTDIDNQRAALQNAATALYYGASNTALRNKVAEAEAVIATSDYEAKYTLAAREALEAEVASAKALSYYTSVLTYQAYNNQNAGKNAQSDQSAIDAVLSELQAALDNLNRNKAYYSHIFNMADGTKKTLSGVYGYVIPSASIPANTVKESDAVNHYSYSWDKEINTTITGPEEYTEVLTSTPHSYTSWTTTVNATCAAEGSMYRECTECGYTQTDVIEKLAHTPLEPVISDEVYATCTAEGSYLETISCSNCGEVISSETITVPKLSHVAGEVIRENETAATCTTDGSYEEVTLCKDCGNEISRKTVIVGAAHKNSDPIVSRTEPTCTTTGAEKTTVMCTVCYEILSENTVILPVTEHKAGEPQKENIIDAGCTVNGSYDMVTRCKDCGFIMNTETVTTEMGQHDWGEWETVKEADCLNDGLEKRVCKNDPSHVEENIIKASGHKDGEPEVIEEVEAACLLDGYKITVTKCTVCGEETSRTRTVLPATGHSFGSWYVSKEATCKEEGENKRDCANCKHSETEVIERKAHTEEEIPAVEASCTSTGLTAGVKCSVCGDVLVAQTTVEKKAHTEEEIPAVAPDCLTDGLTAGVKCSVCGEILEAQETVPALGHDMSEFVETIPATCTSEGEERSDCSRCDYFETQEIEKKAHTEEIIPAVAPTCTEDGLTAGVKCSVCGEILEAQETDPALGHDMSEFVETIPATCTSEGEERSDCSRCDYFETQEIEKKAHTEEEIPAVAPTCTEDGLSAGVKCSVCDEILKAQETTESKLGHDMGEFVVTTPATCKAAGTRTATCKICGEKTTELIPVTNCTPDTRTTIVVGSKVDNILCKEVIKCNVCEKVLYEAESEAAHRTVVVSQTLETCTTARTVVTECRYCNYVCVNDNAAEPLGHEAILISSTPATCVVDGAMVYSGYCSRCNEALENTVVVLKAKGHSASGIQTCITDISCITCGEILATRLGHDIGEFKVVTEATCTAEGEERAYCSRCDYFETQTIAKASHSWADADCTMPSTCTVCGEVSGTAIGHDMGAYVVTTPATCTSEGEERSDCSRCDYFETRATEKAAHTEEELIAIEATCTESGVTAGIVCSVCGEVIVPQTIIPATDHDWGEWSVVTASTCAAAGKEQRVCKNDSSHIEENLLAPLMHTEAEPVAENIKEATCLADGLYEKVVYCSVCGGELSRRTIIIPFKGHDMGAFVEVTAPTCTEAGEERSDCSRCDYYISRELEKIAHTEEIIPAVEATCTSTGLTEGLKCSECGEILKAQTTVEKKAHTEEIIPAVEATCTSTGLTEGVKCSVCGEVLKAQTETEKLGHDMGEFAETKAPTCSEEGEERADCANCDYYETKVIAKKAHTEETVSGKAPTCTEKGLTDGVKCSVCGETITAQKEISAKGHTFGEWQEVKAPTCTEKGLEEALCSECDYVKTRETDIKDHEYDENGVCTECGTEESCMHICHRQHNIFARIVWTIIRYICSIFGIGRTCSCGDMHY